MFAKTIIDSDAFLDMPLSTQALYFHLSMRADDEGFINNPRKIQRMIGASDDDLKLLIAKNFIIPFESGVVVIKHWKIHNYIRGDRLHSTKYTDEKSMLETKENGAYTITSDICQSTDSQMSGTLDTEVRLGKVSIGKNNIYSVHFEKAWGVYLKKKDKALAYKAYKARLNDGYSEDELYLATVKYMEECKKEKREEKYIKNASTFYGPNTPFVDYLPKGGTGNYSKSMEYGRKIYQGDESRTAPYFGFPPEWFEGEQLIEERITPLVCDKSYVQGGREDYEFTIEELKGIYESRKRGKQYEQCFNDIFDS